MLRRLLRADQGSLSIEVALVVSFILVPMLLGLWDLAQIGVGQAQVQEGLQDAISYVAAGNASNSSGIVTAAQKAYGTAISVSSSTACYCVPTNSATPTAPTTVSCTSSCTTNNDFEQFMNITASKTVVIPFAVPYLPNTVTVTASGQVRTG